jgi:imidazolonepropionase-like amidohydrolase
MTQPRLSTLAALVAALASATALRAQQPAPWSVETPPGPSRTLAFDATQGTWMSVTVSPDGRRLAFDLLGHIYELPIEGGTAKRLTDGRSWNLFPRYSPDGRFIAFSSDRSGSHNVWIMDRQDGSLRRLAAPDENVYRPAWSPDGRTIYAAASGDGIPEHIAAFALAGGRQSLVRGGGGVVAPAPDGSWIFHERRGPGPYAFAFNPYVVPPTGARIDRYDPATGESSVFIERPGGAFSPAVSPDGRQLAYVHRAVDETVLIVQDLATGRERVLLRGLDRDRQQAFGGYGPYPTIAWHPDSRRVILGVGGHLTAVDAATGKATRIEFRAPVERPMTETLRFATTEPRERATTRTHRWGTRTPAGILFEALGDLWLQDDKGARQNLTRSDALETSPVFDQKTGTLYYAAWTDSLLGAVYKMTVRPGAQPQRLTSVPAQYGAIAVSPADGRLAYVRGTASLARGGWLSNETRFDLVVREPTGAERRVTGISGQPLEYANIAGKIPPSVLFGDGGETLYFTEFERDTLMLKRIGTDGRGEVVLFRFPNAVAAVPSPNLRWIAVREYQRSYITPFSYAGHPVTVSPYEGQGASVRVDREDGGYLTWSSEGKSLGWTRGTGFYEKEIERIVAEGRSPPAVESGASWMGPRVPGSTATRTETAIEYEIDRPTGTIALTGARLVTMNPGREVLEDATLVIEGSRIAAVGRGVAVPAGARVFDLKGRTVMPGIVDAHAHPHIEHSSLHVIEQQPTYLRGPLAYGVTTLVEVYGNEYRDGWMSDMLRAGKITGSRLYTTGSVIYGQRRGGRRLMFRPIATLDDALEQLRWNKDHGAIAVKDYSQATRKRRHLVATAARMLGLNVVSESGADPQMNLTQVMDGVTGIEHSMGLTPFFDDVVRYWGGSKAGMTPTLLVVYNGAMGEGWFHQNTRLWEDPKLTRFIAPEQLMRVRNPTHLWPEDMYAWQMSSELRKLYAAGTSLQLGAHGQMFGLDAHWELELLAKGGFTPAQVLEIATIRGAAYHGLEGQIGSLEVGKLADLVVLTANPLEDVGNVQKIEYVVKDGIVFAGADAGRVWPDPAAAPRPYFAGQR